ncbi:MAG: DoxX family protein [Vulcanimicrobiaceae bacterium]
MKRLATVKGLLRSVLSLGFVIAGTMHFIRTPFYARMMPPPLDAHATVLIYLSGIGEILGGIGILFPATRKAAGIGLLALLVAVFPANVYMAMRAEAFRDIATPAGLLMRLPMQFVLVAWVWFCTW